MITKERLFEFAMILVGGIGLIILFTLLYNGPSFILYKIAGFFHVRI